MNWTKGPCASRVGLGVGTEAISAGETTNMELELTGNKVSDLPM